MTEHYTGTIDVTFDELPPIRLESYRPAGPVGTAQRLAIATKRRRFSLRDDWRIRLADIDRAERFNGTVVIPATDEDGRPNLFDGASVPLPWLVALLTLGVLRPLGVMLAGSIVHDHAYRHGTLRIERDGEPARDVALERHEADRLFRDIVGTVNRLPAVGKVAWFAVRIGWPWVEYDGKRFGGKVPVGEYALLVAILLALYLGYAVLGATALGCAILIPYLLLYLASLTIDHPRHRDDG